MGEKVFHVRFVFVLVQLNVMPSTVAFALLL